MTPTTGRGMVPVLLFLEKNGVGDAIWKSLFIPYVGRADKVTVWGLSFKFGCVVLVGNKWIRLYEQIHTFKCHPDGKVPISFEVNGKPLKFDESELNAEDEA